MTAALTIPEVGESVTEAHILRWLKPEGAHVDKDEPVVELETDKATLELPAPVAGTLTGPLRPAGEVAAIGDVIGHIRQDGEGGAKEPAARDVPSNGGEPKEKAESAAPPPPPPPPGAAKVAQAAEKKEPETVPAPQGRRAPAEEPAVPAGSEAPAAAPRPAASPVGSVDSDDNREEEIVAMSPMRRRIAQRLVQAQQETALLTTFNEVDMSAVQALRQRHREAFEKKYKVRLGFMSFFVKAAIDALKQTPALNAQISGTNIVYRNYYDIGVAISTERGLVVPVLRNAHRMSFAEIETAIGDLAARARTNHIKVEELRGGTFTITNGGVFGSLLSTPIVNPPQSGVLGMHTIQDRPVVRDGNIVIRPMMYLALTYDHRIVDGREAITFLKRIAEAVEEPARMLIEV